jgi:hypothetical protein
MEQTSRFKPILCMLVTIMAAYVMLGKTVYAANNITKESLSPAPETTVDILYQKDAKGKLPLVVFAHNGGATKEDWGDYPSELAAKGYISASIGWKNMKGHADFTKALNAIMKKYSGRIDSNRVAFIGGCHGAVKMIELMNDPGNTISFNTIVFLSVSEPAVLKGNHAPILGIYSTDDHLGSYYRNFTKKYVEEMISSPNKAIAYKGDPHGNELVTDKAAKESIRKEIGSWLSANLK